LAVSAPAPSPICRAPLRQLGAARGDFGQLRVQLPNAAVQFLLTRPERRHSLPQLLQAGADLPDAPQRLGLAGGQLLARSLELLLSRVQLRCAVAELPARRKQRLQRGVGFERRVRLQQLLQLRRHLRAAVRDPPGRLRGGGDAALELIGSGRKLLHACRKRRGARCGGTDAVAQRSGAVRQLARPFFQRSGGIGEPSDSVGDGVRSAGYGRRRVREAARAGPEPRCAVRQIVRAGRERQQMFPHLADAVGDRRRSFRQFARPAARFPEPVRQLGGSLDDASGVGFGDLDGQFAFQFAGGILADLGGDEVVVPVRFIDELRLTRIVRADGDGSLGEIFGHGDHRVIFVRGHAAFRLFEADDPPVERLVVLQFLQKIVSRREEFPLVFGAPIQIDDGDRKFLKLSVRIPVAPDQKAGIQDRHEGDRDERQGRNRPRELRAQVMLENVEDSHVPGSFCCERNSQIPL